VTEEPMVESHERMKQFLIFGDKSLLLTWGAGHSRLIHVASERHH